MGKGRRAGSLDEEEKDVLELRLRGFTREFVLERCAANDAERLKLQAAWRRLDRHMERVREVFLQPDKNSTKNVPKSQHSDTR